MKDEVVVVTGAGRGIGAATAKLFAARGATVALLSRTRGQIEASAAMCGERAKAYVCDVSDEAAVNATFDKIAKELGAPTILINNAGIARIGRLEETSLALWNETFAINVTGSFLCAKAFVRHFSARSGCIVNIASLAGVRNLSFPGYIAYSSSKHAVVGLSEDLSKELRPRGIRVNCLAPGMIDTDMLAAVLPEAAGNAASPDKMASIICSICDESQMSLLNGAVIEVHCNV